MKFWQKTFVAVLLLFLLGFSALLFGMLSYSERLNEELTMQAAQTELNTLSNAITDKLRRVSDQHTHFTVEALRMHLQSLAEVYGQRAAFFEIDTGNGKIFSSLSGGDVGVDDGTHYVQSQPLHISDMASMQLTLAKDVSVIAQHREQMMRYGVWIFLILFTLLAGILLLLLLRLTKPLRTLTRTAQQISQGQLDRRVSIPQKDEIGAFAASFNQMADAVQRQMSDLEEVNAQRQWFIDSLAHELRTPVTAIVGYGEALKYANITPEQQDKSLTYIIEQGNRIQGLSEKLLELARLQHGQVVMKPVLLGEIVARATEALERSAATRGVRVVAALEPVSVNGDAVLLETLVINLLENAVRASQTGQAVVIRTGLAEGKPYLAVQDTGIGIAPEEQRRVMEAFYRVDISRSRANGGAGLGLTLCKQICLLHNAAFLMDSDVDKGCAVTIEFTTPQQLSNEFL